jgi:hypothetical protein
MIATGEPESANYLINVIGLTQNAHGFRLLATLIVVLGALSGSSLAIVGIPIAALLAATGYFWVNRCKPTLCRLLQTLIAGVGTGAAVLAILALLGLSAPQLVTILAGSIVLTGAAALVAWLGKCF